MLPAVAACNATPEDSGATAQNAVATSFSKNVLVVIFEPRLSDGRPYWQGLHDLNSFTWFDPRFLSSQLAGWIHEDSHQQITLSLGFIVMREFPRRMSGGSSSVVGRDGALSAQEVVDAFARDAADPTVPPQMTFDYASLLRGMDSSVEGAPINILQWVNERLLDEVWVWAGPSARMAESRMVAAQPYSVNGDGLQEAGQRPFIVMGLNEQGPAHYAYHSFGHRVESMLAHQTGTGWWRFRDTSHATEGVVDMTQTTNWFEQFVARDWQVPGLGGVGTIHCPVNGCRCPITNPDMTRGCPAVAWDWARSEPVFSYAAAFREAIAPASFVPQPIGCSAWGCTQEGYMRFWHSSLPHGQTRAGGGELPNAWSMVFPD